MSFPLEDLPETVIVEYIERLPDREFALMCMQPISKKISKLCNSRGDFRKRMETLKSRKEVTEYNNRTVEKYYNVDRKLSNYFGPAVIDSRNGNVYSEEFWINGEKRALDPNDPVLIEYYKDGRVKFEEYDIDGQTIEKSYSVTGQMTESSSGPLGSIMKVYEDDGTLKSMVENFDEVYSLRTLYLNNGGRIEEYLYMDENPGREDEGPLLIEYDADDNVVKELFTVKEAVKYYE